jgi:hypothetical protein
MAEQDDDKPAVLDYATPGVTDAKADEDPPKPMSRTDVVVIAMGFTLLGVYFNAGVLSDHVRVPPFKKAAILLATGVVVVLLAKVALGRAGCAMWFALYLFLIVFGVLVMMVWN